MSVDGAGMYGRVVTSHAENMELLLHVFDPEVACVSRVYKLAKV